MFSAVYYDREYEIKAVTITAIFEDEYMPEKAIGGFNDVNYKFDYNQLYVIIASLIIIFIVNLIIYIFNSISTVSAIPAPKSAPSDYSDDELEGSAGMEEWDDPSEDEYEEEEDCYDEDNDNVGLPLIDITIPWEYFTPELDTIFGAPFELNIIALERLIHKLMHYDIDVYEELNDTFNDCEEVSLQDQVEAFLDETDDEDDYQLITYNDGDVGDNLSEDEFDLIYGDGDYDPHDIDLTMCDSTDDESLEDSIEEEEEEYEEEEEDDGEEEEDEDEDIVNEQSVLKYINSTYNLSITSLNNHNPRIVKQLFDDEDTLNVRCLADCMPRAHVLLSNIITNPDAITNAYDLYRTEQLGLIDKGIGEEFEDEDIEDEDALEVEDLAIEHGFNDDRNNDFVVFRPGEKQIVDISQLELLLTRCLLITIFLLVILFYFVI